MSDNNKAIVFENVKKTYANIRYGYSSISEIIRNKFFAKGKVISFNNERNVLNGVSFTINKGETVGLVGPNGAGKSTMLKLISKVTCPNNGKINVFGSLGALIEVGAGFHPELTGRENIYVNGVLLGLNRKEIKKKYDEIVEFAGLKEYIEIPVKRYSSGMFVRLGFSIIVCINPDVLLIDEALAVGDSEFQKKSLQKIQDLKKDGKTMVLVSHNMFAVESICTRCIWIENGIVKQDGHPKEVLKGYLGSHEIKDKEDIFNVIRKGD